MYGQPCFECESNGEKKFFLNFAKIFTTVFKVSSKFAEDYIVMIIQDEKKIITHPAMLIKKNYRIINHGISIFGQTFDLHKTIICFGYIAVFVDQ